MINGAQLDPGVMALCLQQLGFAVTLADVVRWTRTERDAAAETIRMRGGAVPGFLAEKRAGTEAA